MSARLLSTADADAWNAALPAERSGFGSLDFARAQERGRQGLHRLLVAETGGAQVAYPLELRPLADLPFTAELDGGRWDSASPPFTGPLVSGDLAGAELEALSEEVASLLAAEGVVAEFAHLHPWAAEPALVGGAEPDREIVWVDLTLDPERLRSESYSSACRRNVNRAEREGVTVRPAGDEADIAEFHRIYTQTMERNLARDAYFLDRGHFQAIFDEMPANARFALAEHEGRVIAGALCIHDREDVYYYFGASDRARQQLRPTNAVIDETIRWGWEHGKQRLILGGGYRADDGILRFKGSFSPLRATLQLARRIHRPADYEALVSAWRARHSHDGQGSSFFPLYRATP